MMMQWEQKYPGWIISVPNFGHVSVSHFHIRMRGYLVGIRTPETRKVRTLEPIYMTLEEAKAAAEVVLAEALFAHIRATEKHLETLLTMMEVE